GSKVQLTLRATTEDKKAAPAWFLAAVVDERVLGTANRLAAGFPAHFQLLTELRQAAGLGEAEVVLAEGAPARQGLALFLGTLGWRGCVTPKRAARLAQAADKGKEGGQDVSGLPALFNRDNAAEARQQYTASLAAAREQLRKDAAALGDVLQTERTRHL